MSTRHPLEPRRPLLGPLLLGLVALLIAGFATTLLVQRFILAAWYQDHDVPISATQLAGYIYGLAAAAAARTASMGLAHPWIYLSGIATAVDKGLDQYDLVGRSRAALTMVAVSAVAACLAAAVTTWWVSPKRSRVRHVSGRELLLNRHARRFFARAERRARKATGRGLYLAPGMVMGRERETRHILIQGATGSGKTVIIRYLLRQMIVRGDRVLLHDTKGDFLAGLPADEFVLLAPHDSRSALWDVAADVCSTQDARELAASLIPESKDPVWAGGAREILIGCIVILQRTMGRNWGWNDLYQTVFTPAVQLKHQLSMHYATGMKYIDLDPTNMQPTKIGFSFLVTVYANASAALGPLAKAWSGKETPRFSVRTWLMADDPRKRIIVMQRAPHLPALSRAWTCALVRTLARTAVGPEIPDDPNRRVFLLLDELPQLGKLADFGQLLEAGRSKGVAAVMAVQDTNQLVETYGPATAATWQSLVGTTVIGRTGPGQTAQTICETLIGKRRVSWTTRNFSWAGWKWDGSGGGTTRSRQVETHQIEAVHPSYLEAELGVFYSGLRPEVRALILGVSDGARQAVLQAAWPIEPWPTRRKPSEPAAWLDD